MGRPIKKSIIQHTYIYPQTGVQRLITKQKGSRRYECEANGDTVFRLVASSSPSANEAYMLAYDSDGNTYFVTKLTRHYATLVQKEQVGVPGFQFTSNSAVEWIPFHSAIAGQTIAIDNNL